MKKTKRILALIGVILLVGMYILTFIASLISKENSAVLFKASLYCTVIIPLMLYGYILIYRLLKNRNHNKGEEDE